LLICLDVKQRIFKSWFSFFIEEVDKNKDNSIVVFLCILFSLNIDYNI